MLIIRRLVSQIALTRKCPLPRVKKILKNTNEMNASEDVESKNKSSISSLFMLNYFKDLVRI